MRIVLTAGLALLCACGGTGPSASPSVYVAIGTLTLGTWIARYQGLTLTDAAESPHFPDDVTMAATLDVDNGDIVWVHGGPRAGSPVNRWRVDVLDPNLTVIRSKADSEIVSMGDSATVPVTGPATLLPAARLMVMSAVRGAGKVTHGLLVLDADSLTAVGFYPVNALYPRLVQGSGLDLILVLTSSAQAGGQELVELDVRTGAIVDSATVTGAVALSPAGPGLPYVETPDSLKLLDGVSGVARLAAPLDFEGPMLSVGGRGIVVVADGALGGTGAADVFDGTTLNRLARITVVPDSIAQAPYDLGDAFDDRYLYVATIGASLSLAEGYLALVDLDTQSVPAIVRLPGPGRVIQP